MWQILRRNPGAFGAAMMLHLLLAILALVGADWLIRFEEVRAKPQVVQARILSSEAVQAEAKRRAQAEAQRQAETERRAQAEAQRQAEAERRAQAEAQRQAEAERRAQAEAQRQAEAERRAQAEAQRRAEAERRAEEEAQRRAEAERRAQAEAQRQAEEKAQRAREEALLAALDQEQAVGELDSYVNAIHERIRSVWVRQPGMGQALSCLVEARLIPGGEVVSGSVRLLRSSGNPAFDRSVVAAVYKASPLLVPSGRLFDHFRNLRLSFRP